MKVFSKTHTITAEAGAAVKPVLGANGKPISKTSVVNHPAGTVLDLPDDSANDLINRGAAEEFKPEEHKDDSEEGTVKITHPGDQLPDGQSHPSDVRQDGTLNDGPQGKAPEKTVYRDTKDDKTAQAAREAALKDPAPGAATTAMHNV